MTKISSVLADRSQCPMAGSANCPDTFHHPGALPPGTSRPSKLAKRTMLAICAAMVTIMSVSAAVAAEGVLVPRAQGWLVESFGEAALPANRLDGRSERAALKAIAAKRTAHDLARFRWWATGGPAYRWNEIILNELQEQFVTLPLSARHLALFHTAIDDAVAVARHSAPAASARPLEIDAAVIAAPRSGSPIPSQHAAAASAAAAVLSDLFPAHADRFAAMAEEATRSRLLAGVEYPGDVAAGRALGQRIAGLAIARGHADGSKAVWSGSVPEGQGRWQGTNPIAPLAGTWRPWVLSQPSEFRPAPPPSIDSPEVASALKELKSFPRTPKSNHRAIYWEVHGGARAHTLWNEIARTKLLEQGEVSPLASRVLAAVNVALIDAGIACWDAKYTFWYPRPSQRDPELKPLFAPPNHPSYPAAHGCFSTAAATVLAAIFPQDRERLLALGKEAAEARVWAGIHYRFDIEAGQEIGRKVAEKTLERAFAAGTH
jgi:membrane-associated phospholipid phosphatase